MISKLQKTKRHKKSVLKSSCRAFSCGLGTDTFEYTLKTIKKTIVKAEDNALTIRHLLMLKLEKHCFTNSGIFGQSV